MPSGDSLQTDLAEVLNFYSAENGSDTPDFILATYLLACLDAFNHASRRREVWYGKALKPGGILGLASRDGGIGKAPNAEAGACGEGVKDGAQNSSSGPLPTSPEPRNG